MYEVSDYAYSLHVVMTVSDTREMLMLMNRALNTVEPKDWPQWAANFIERLEKFSHAKTAALTNNDRRETWREMAHSTMTDAEMKAADSPQERTT